VASIKGKAAGYCVIVEWNERALAALADQLDFMLSTWPNMGKPGRAAGLRELVIPQTPFLVLYRVMEDRVRIVRLLHGAQQYP
jgi:toxin ParE1/3/4